jgi:hypothetical protein
MTFILVYLKRLTDRIKLFTSLGQEPGKEGKDTMTTYLLTIVFITIVLVSAVIVSIALYPPRTFITRSRVPPLHDAIFAREG